MSTVTISDLLVEVKVTSTDLDTTDSEKLSRTVSIAVTPGGFDVIEDNDGINAIYHDASLDTAMLTAVEIASGPLTAIGVTFSSRAGATMSVSAPGGLRREHLFATFDEFVAGL